MTEFAGVPLKFHGNTLLSPPPFGLALIFLGFGLHPSNLHPAGPNSLGPHGAAGVSHDSPRAQKCTFEGPGLQSHHQNSTKRPPREEERMKIVAGEGKKERNFGRSGGGESGGGKSGERPKFGRTDENFEHTPHRHTTPQQQRHTTQHNGGSRTGWSWAGGSLAGRSMAPKKKDMRNKLAAPLAKVFWGQGWFAKVWAQLGQKWCGPRVFRKTKKRGKTNQKIYPSPLHPKPKNEKTKK